MIKAQLRSFVSRFPRLKACLRAMLNLLLPHRGVSSHYVEIARDEALLNENPLHQSWKSEVLPERQRILVDEQLAAFRNGQDIVVFRSLVESLRGLLREGETMSVLEVGCSSGYYGEVFRIAGLPVVYAGCDYSQAFVDLARARYPEFSFMVEDATHLSYGDGEFDIVVSGCCLLHIPRYQAAVAETARVARRYAVFHRTPVVLGQPNKYYRKKAYGIETVEIHFNEPDFLALLDASGLELIGTHTLEESIRGGMGNAVRTYVCRRKTA